jgi:2-C-methyl-D-erythritol 4-phosphate cytidylyltransferase
MNKSVYAIVVAGGSGTRMKTTVPKQFHVLLDKPILIHTLEAFLKAESQISIVLVLPSLYMELGQSLVAQYLPNRSVQCVVGGETRFHSVKNGLAVIPSDAIVMVHDAVRCLLSSDLIIRCIEQANLKGSAIPAIASKDSVRLLKSDKSVAIPRDEVRLIQTPQTFEAGMLKKAFLQEYNHGFTDEASVVENMGEQVHLIEGEEQNIKITYPVDLLLAEQLLTKG